MGVERYAGAGQPDALERLEEAARGLLVPSESDAPLTPLRWGAGSPDAAALRAHAGLADDAPAQAWSVEGLLGPLCQPQSWHSPRQRADAERFAALRALVDELLSDVRVWRLGAVEEHVYLLGRDGAGELVGLRTTLVRT